MAYQKRMCHMKRKTYSRTVCISKVGKDTHVTITRWFAHRKAMESLKRATRKDLNSFDEQRLSIALSNMKPDSISVELSGSITALTLLYAGDYYV